MAISLPPKGNDAKVLGSYFSPLKVEAQATPNMTVQVSEGTFWTSNNEHMEYIGGTSPNISPAATAAKWVLVTVTPTGLLNVINGAEDGNPVLPDPATYKDELPLAAIFVGDTTTAITNEMVYDIRPQWSIPPDSVNQSQLTDFATITYVNNGLDLKADISGTPDALFTLNSAGSFINEAELRVNRFSLPDVGIRFNETAAAGSPPVVTPAWEFTNDGATWNPIGVSTGSYYTKDDLDGGALDSRYFTQNDLNVTGVLDGRYYEKTIADATLAPIVHTHPASDIIGLSDPVETINSMTPTNGDIQLGLNELNDVTNVLPADSHVIVRRTGSYINDFLNLNDLSDVDTVATPPVINDVLIHNGAGGFTNRTLVKTDISDFTGGEFVLTTNLVGDPPNGSNGTPQDVYGVKTFKDGVIIETSLVITGADTSIETTNLKVTDPYIILNDGETGDGVGGVPTPGVGGIAIDRGFATGSPGTANPAAVFQWDEGTKQWEAGVQGAASPILTGAHNHISTEITDFAVRTTTELGNNNLDTLKDVSYLSSPPAPGEYLRYGINDWENKDFATDVNAELNINNLDQMQDVVYLGSPALATGDHLQWNGVAWENHVPVKADISDFVETDYIHTTGDETKVGSLTITGDFIVDDNSIGSETRLQSEHVYISDTVITLNADETVDGGAVVAGIEILRGPTYDKTAIRWDELSGNWFISTGTGATLTTAPISTDGHTHTISDVTDVSATGTELNQLVGINTTTTVQTQLDTKFDGTFDITVDPTVALKTTVTENLIKYNIVSGNPTAIFNTTHIKLGHVGNWIDIDSALFNPLLLKNNTAVQAYDETYGINVKNLISRTASGANVPPIQGPTNYDNEVIVGDTDITTAIRSGTVGTNDPVVRAGVFGATDDWKIWHEGNLIPATSADLAAHAADLDLHITTVQNDFLDNLTLTGSPALTAADVNQLIGVSGNVQTLLDTKTDKLIPAIDQNIAALDLATGNIVDSGVVVDDAGTTVNELWTANKIDTTKADKIIPATVNNFAILDATGNLADSGLILDDASSTITDIWSANKIDNTKMDKLVGIAGNFAEFDGIGNVVDNGTNSTAFATTIHTHVIADITDFAAGVTTELNNNSIDELIDVSTTSAAGGDLLRWKAIGTGSPPSAIGVWEPATTSSITEFVHTFDDEIIGGVKTFSDNMFIQGNTTITQSLTVNNGAAINGDVAIIGDQSIQGRLTVADNNIVLNFASAVAATAAGGGMILQREAVGSPIGLPNAVVIWDHPTSRWVAGLGDNPTPIALENITVAQPDYELVEAPAGSPLQSDYTMAFIVPEPVAGKTAIQVFVNGIKQIEGATKAYTVDYAPINPLVSFNPGSEPAAGTDVEFYGFGLIG